MRTTIICAAVAVLFVLSDYANAAVETITKSMSFEQCLQVIRGTASDLRIAPINIVETRDMRMVRFPASGGSVLITCSRLDRKMAIIKSDKKY